MNKRGIMAEKEEVKEIDIKTLKAQHDDLYIKYMNLVAVLAGHGIHVG